MRSIFALVVVLTASSASPSGTARADVLAQWNFNGPSSTEVPGGTIAPSPSHGDGIASLVGGVTSPASFSTGESNGGSSDPAGGPPPNYAWQTTTYAAQGTGSGERGVQFAVSTVGHSDIVVRWDQRHSNTSSRFVQFQYSIDGVTFTSDGLPADGIFEANLGGDAWYTARVVDLSGVSGVADNPDFAFRIVAVFAPAAEHTRRRR